MKTSKHPIPPSFQKNEVRFGHAAPGLIAVELDGDDRVKIFSRGGNVTSSETAPFQPFLLLAGDGGLRGWRSETRIEVLDGHGEFNRLALFPSLKQDIFKPWIKLAKPKEQKVALSTGPAQFSLLVPKSG